jgi:hypothetical protein
MVDLAQQIGDGATQRVVLQPPTYTFHPATSSTGGIYTLRLRLEAVHALSVQIFGTDSVFWSGTFDPAGSPIPLSP